MNRNFPKLSGNTYNAQFQLRMSPWRIFVQKVLKMQFSSIFVERIDGFDFKVGKGWVALDLPKNNFVLLGHHRILVLS